MTTLPQAEGHDVPTQSLFGLDFVSDASVERITALVLEDTLRDDIRWRSVVTPNVDHLVRYRSHADEAAVAQRSYLVLPDGMPIVWSSRLLGRPLRHRLTGSDLFAVLWPRLVAGAVPVVVVAPTGDVAELLEHEHGACSCVVPPMFDAEAGQEVNSVLDAVEEAIERVRAKLVFISLSQPKAHALADGLWRRWSNRSEPAPIVLLVGAAPEFYLDVRRRAPRWMRSIGLEWLHRLISDPRRMARRYLYDDVVFFALVWDEFRGRR